MLVKSLPLGVLADRSTDSAATRTGVNRWNGWPTHASAAHWEPIYSASKHAVQTFVHTLRRQVAKYGIRVGAVAPGMVANELWGITDREDIDRRVAERTCLRSEDVADGVVFMLSRPPHVTIRDLVMLPQSQDL